MNGPREPRISVVVPVYRGEECLRELHRRLVATLEKLVPTFELVLVEDGGPDKSWDLIVELAKADPRVRGFQLSRNFGQHPAITAGLDRCRGEWVVIMDCDLQDQPEEIAKLWAEAQRGTEVVLALRRGRADSLYRRLASAAFHRLFAYLTGVDLDKDVAGFCLLHARVVESLRTLREKDRFLMGFVSWVGFSVAKVEVAHAPRFAGSTSYTIGRLLRLAWNTSLAFSNKPLHLMVKAGCGLALLSVVVAVVFLIIGLLGGVTVPGWASVIVSVYFLGGLNLITLGVLGIYIGKVFDQTKQRPIYIERRSTEELLGAPALAGGPGHVFWITGLAGAGKTTLAREVRRLVAERFRSEVVLIDGDDVRRAMGNDLGYDPPDRLKNAKRISSLCKLISDQGVHVVCATISLFHEIHRWNRANLARYHEVFVQASPETLARRDQKGLWSDGARVVGIDQTYEAPEAPDLVVKSDDGVAPAAAALRVVSLLDKPPGRVEPAPVEVAR